LVCCTAIGLDWIGLDWFVCFERISSLYDKHTDRNTNRERERERTISVKSLVSPDRSIKPTTTTIGSRKPSMGLCLCSRVENCNILVLYLYCTLTVLPRTAVGAMEGGGHRDNCCLWCDPDILGVCDVQ
jgi:hypothetical protein